MELRTFASIAEDILARPPRRGGTRFVAVDGGSAAGKTTFARRLATTLDASLVHVDDVSWWESFFGWTPLLVDGVLAPLQQGRQVRFRPPAWEHRAREGAIAAEPGPAVVVEGVGANGADDTDPGSARRACIEVEVDPGQHRGRRGCGRTRAHAGARKAWSNSTSGRRTMPAAVDGQLLRVANGPRKGTGNVAAPWSGGTSSGIVVGRCRTCGPSVRTGRSRAPGCSVAYLG